MCAMESIISKKWISSHRHPSTHDELLQEVALAASALASPPFLLGPRHLDDLMIGQDLS